MRKFTVWRATVVAAFVTTPIFVSIVRWHPQGDFATHMAIAKEASSAFDLFSYSLYYPLQAVLSIDSRSQASMEAATIAMAIVFVAAHVWVSGRYALREGLAESVSGVIALVVTFMMPALDPAG